MNLKLSLSLQPTGLLINIQKEVSFLVRLFSHNIINWNIPRSTWMTTSILTMLKGNSHKKCTQNKYTKVMLYSHYNKPNKGDYHDKGNDTCLQLEHLQTNTKQIHGTWEIHGTWRDIIPWLAECKLLLIHKYKLFMSYFIKIIIGWNDSVLGVLIFYIWSIFMS